MNLKLFPVPVWANKGNWERDIEYKPWRIRTIIRNKYRCVDCGNGRDKLVVYSIDQSSSSKIPNRNSRNLITVCNPCRAKRLGSANGFRNSIISNLEELAPDKIIEHGTLALIARDLGSSRERVRQIAKQLGYIMPMRKDRPPRKFTCRNCKSKFTAERQRVCCSGKCYKEYYDKKYWTTIKCKNCGKPKKFYKRYIYLGKTPTFCNKYCQGKFLGMNYSTGRPKRERT